jgi:oxygen-independent coproporphyrinogen-3 oxidase
MDPGTFTASTLLELEEAGITRLSLGIQSFDNDILIACGRAHSAEDSLRAIETIHASSTLFKDNFSLDLISSLPKLTLKGWEKTLRQVIIIPGPPTHLHFHKSYTYGEECYNISSSYVYLHFS